MNQHNEILFTNILFKGSNRQKRRNKRNFWTRYLLVVGVTILATASVVSVGDSQANIRPQVINTVNKAVRIFPKLDQRMKIADPSANQITRTVFPAVVN